LRNLGSQTIINWENLLSK